MSGERDRRSLPRGLTRHQSPASSCCLNVPAPTPAPSLILRRAKRGSGTDGGAEITLERTRSCPGGRQHWTPLVTLVSQSASGGGGGEEEKNVKDASQKLWDILVLGEVKMKKFNLIYVQRNITLVSSWTLKMEKTINKQEQSPAS